MNGRILCFTLAWALCFLSLPANAEVKRSNRCVHSCSVSGVHKLGQEGSDGKHFKHTYIMSVDCAGYYESANNLTTKQLSVNAQYSPLSKLGVEKIGVRGPYGEGLPKYIETSFRCDRDPWRSNSGCTQTGYIPTHTSTSGGGDQYEVNWSLCPGAIAPISRGGREKILAAIADKPSWSPLPAPIIVSPGDEEEFPNYGLIEIEVKDPPGQGWFTDYNFPDTVTLEWYYLGPDDGWHDAEMKDVIPEITITAVGETGTHRVIDAKYLREGKWRIEAAFSKTPKHSLEPEIRKRVFWIGGKVDSTKPLATIQKPRNHSLHPDDPVQALIRYESAGNPNKPKAPSDSAPGTGMPGLVVELQWVRWSEKDDDWKSMEFAVTRDQASNANFDLWSAGEGKFRIRARGRSSAEYKGPWSPWTTYYVGEAGDRLKPQIRDVRVAAGRDAKEGTDGGSSGTVRKLRPLPPPRITTTVTFNRVKIRLGGLLSSSEYRFEYQGFTNGQWKSLNPQGHDQLLPPPSEIAVPLTVFGSAAKARVHVRAEKPNRGSWGNWKEFDPTPGLRAPIRPPPFPSPSPGPPAPGDSKPKFRRLRPPPS